MSIENPNSEVLATDLRRVIADGAQVLKTVEVDPEALRDLRGSANVAVRHAGHRLAYLGGKASVGGKRAASAAGRWAVANPRTALAFGAGIGLIAGVALLLRSRSQARRELAN